VDLNTVTELVGADQTSWRPGDAFLAGGSWLFSEPQPGVRRLLDLTSYRWPALRITDAGLEIAATCTLAELAAAELPAPVKWLIRQCCSALLGSFKIWNVATVGGNICLSLPAGPMTSLAASLDGTATILSPGGRSRSQPVAEFVTGDTQNTLQPGEILRSVSLPAAALNCRTAFAQQSLTRHGRSAALAIGRLAETGETVLTLTAATIRPYQFRFDSLPEPDSVLQALDAAEPDYHQDVHGARVWRAQLSRQLLVQVRDELAG
jgi:CO/xanthine dehydrogenase FAD-binding subunit